MIRRYQIFCLIAVLSCTLTAISQCANGAGGSQALSLTIQLARDTVKVGDPVLVDVVLTNNSPQDVSIWRENGPDAGESYKIDVRDELGEPGRDTKLGYYRNGHVDLSKVKPEEIDQKYLNGSGACFVLRAGASLHDEIDVARFYLLSKPGQYSIQLSVLDPVVSKEVKSKAATITVTP
jgi:hypothetical protein